MAYQVTVVEKVELKGVGVHSGKPVSLTISPADADTGIIFNRVDICCSEAVGVKALYRNVCSTFLCTALGDISKPHVRTVEHLMSALQALNVDNAIIELDGSEVPIMDGSAYPFIVALDQAGLKYLPVRRNYIRVKKPVRVDFDLSHAELLPYDGMRFEVEINFGTPLIGKQSFHLNLTPELFRTELSRARTFGFTEDVKKLWSAGHALGASLENSIVISDNRILNPEGLRYADEFVRHKTLDAIGDLALAGYPILGCFRSYRAGHKLNILTLKALFSDEDAFEIVGSDDQCDTLQSGENNPVIEPGSVPIKS